MTIIWYEPIAQRYFLVPDDYVWPAGSVKLQSSNNEERLTDPDALTAFEVTRAEAEAHFTAEIEAGFAQAKTLIDDLLTSGQAQTNAQHAAGDLLVGLKALLEGTVEDDTAQREAAQRQLAETQERLAAQGIDFDLTDVAKNLQAWYKSFSDEDALRNLGANLVAFVNEGKSSDAPLGQQIDEAIQKLEQQFGGIATTRAEATQRQERRESARKAAQSDIAKALKGRNITPLSTRSDKA